MHAPLDRRSFLLGSAAVVGTAALGFQSRAEDKDKDPFGGFTVAVQSYTFRAFKLERMLKATQDVGIKNAEMYPGHIPANSSPDAIKGYLKLCGEYGVTPVSFGVVGFSKDTDKNKKLFEFGAALGVKSLSADPDPDSFDSLDKLVAEYKIAVAIHPHGPSGGGKMHRWRDAASILKTIKDHHELIGTCLDTGHLIRAAQLDIKLDPVEQIKIMGARNFGLHLKDHDNKRMTDVPFGDKTGVLDVLGVLKELKDVKFKGYIAIEYEASEKDPTADVKTCVAYFKEQVKKLG